MEALSIILVPILNFFMIAIRLYSYIIIARAIMSFFVQDYYSNPIVNFIFRITEPVLQLARNMFPFLRIGMFDFSIIVIFIILEIFERFLDFLIRKMSFF